MFDFFFFAFTLLNEGEKMNVFPTYTNVCAWKGVNDSLKNHVTFIERSASLILQPQMTKMYAIITPSTIDLILITLHFYLDIRNKKWFTRRKLCWKKRLGNTRILAISLKTSHCKCRTIVSLIIDCNVN